MRALRTSSLSAARRQLVQLIQSIEFGQVLDLKVRKGEPVLQPMPRVLRSVKLGRDTGARAEIPAGDFTVRTEVIELLLQLSQIRDGVIRRLDVKNGLPISMVVEESAPTNPVGREQRRP